MRKTPLRNYSTHPSYCATDFGTGDTGLPPKATANVRVTRTRCRQERHVSSSKRVRRYLQKRPPASSTGRPNALRTGRVLRKTRRETLLHGVPRRKAQRSAGAGTAGSWGGKGLVWMSWHPGQHTAEQSTRAAGSDLLGRSLPRLRGKCLVLKRDVPTRPPDLGWDSVHGKEWLGTR